jgi:hypothetical protein
VEPEKRPKTLKLSIVISLSLSIAIILAILYLTFDSQTLSYLSGQNIKYEFFFAAVLINFIYWFFWGARLRSLTNAVESDVKISLWESTKIVMANLFLANITPSMAGGEPVRIYLLNKDGLSVGRATAAVLGERLLDALFLIICFPFAFLVFRSKINTGVLSIGLTIALVVFLLVVVIFIYALKNPEKVKSLIIFLNKKLARFSIKKQRESKIVERINEEVDNFHESMVCFLSNRKKDFLKACFLTAAFWITGWMVPVLILMGLGLQPHIIESCAAQILLIIIVMMPTTPGSAGVTEGGAAALYSVFIGPHLIGVFILLFRLITYHMGLIVGAIFQYRIFKSVASFSLDTIKTRK